MLILLYIVGGILYMMTGLYVGSYVYKHKINVLKASLVSGSPASATEVGDAHVLGICAGMLFPLALPVLVLSRPSKKVIEAAGRRADRHDADLIFRTQYPELVAAAHDELRHLTTNSWEYRD